MTPLRSIRLLAALMAALWVSACATLPKDVHRPVSHAFADTGDTRIGRAIADSLSSHPGKSGFFLLANGLDAFVARAVLAQAADRSIDVQYYLYHEDLIGALLTDQLVQAADRGVRVRLLVDDMDLEGRDAGAAVLDSHPHIEVRIFNPFTRNTARVPQFLTRFGSVTRRMHNKSFTVDNQVTILGGRNIGNEYFEADPDLAFADLDVMAAGEVAGAVSTAFDLYWNSELAYPVSALKPEPPDKEQSERLRRQLDAVVSGPPSAAYIGALERSKLAETLRQGDFSFSWGHADVIYDEPEKILRGMDETRYHMGPQIAPYFAGVQKELILFSPYFVPGKAMTSFLTDLVRRGVTVRILTNSLASNDVGIVHAGYAKYRKPLLAGGVQLYELNKKLSAAQRKEKKGGEGSSKASLHIKSFVFDRRQVFIGSLNLDPRAAIHNTEIGVVFDSTELASEMAEWFVENIEQVAFRLELVKEKGGGKTIRWHGRVDGKPVIFDTEPYTGFWRRLGIGFLSLLPIESQL
jgi:putative cardiolipin synthase